MLTCKQVSKTLEHNNYEDLSVFRRFLVRFHIAICMICGKYNTQVIEMHKMTRCFRDHADAGETAPDIHLSDEKREELKALAVADSQPPS